MWPFIKQQRKQHNPDTYTESSPFIKPRRQLTLQQMVEGIGDPHELAHDDVALKFWLPEPAMAALRELADYYSMTMSRLLRQQLFIHIYGAYTYEWLCDQHPGLFRELEVPAFSRRGGIDEDAARKKRITTYWVPELGKNIKAMKLWIPQRMKEDLTLLAEHLDLTASNYVREVVISRLLGHGTLPMRPKMMQYSPSSETEAWDNDQEVSWREVSETESSAEAVVDIRHQEVG
ncbi:MAG: hypothetical protein HQL48_08665 [Gammaproteobacteria bacterium]|nr:hypothetical protein [Gammaproteobacteria bacterium]